MFLFGEGIGNGFHGSQPDLSNIDETDDPAVEHDFRNVYASVLKNWLCIEPTLVDYVMGSSFDPLPGLVPACNYVDNANYRAALMGHKISLTQPNTVEFHYSIKYRSKVLLQILNQQGQVIFTLVDAVKDPGSHIENFDMITNNLPPSRYHYRLNTGGESFIRKIDLF